MMLVPTFLYAGGMLGRAPLFDGDVRKEMTCLTCNGMGRTGKDETCATCHGRGVADYIIPGPHRPQQLIGTVKDSHGDKVAGAAVAAREKGISGEDVLLETNDSGQFGLKVPPGTYEISITSPNSGSLTQTLEVVQNTTPVPATGYDTLNHLEKEFTLSK